ncbi:putative iron-dependent peroxidase [Pedobacter steynii]|uniref:Putative iron-dependent peroxidase n=1 Tax=Pedobacter steynii TaxID=430522 RepID=A0A1G9RI81_9SPHI|nr:Dyp-type peroxidase [Pedobacter steynii]NQX37746.1 Dyp-type peroxidase [Pedobacter steynii]SDM23032.1 putative iron-dependent peroxidase [Pedobacter steynii]
MNPESQQTLADTNSNTIFMVWNFKENLEVKDIFNRLCKLVINLNNSAAIRFPVSRASCVMGIGYDAWLRLDLPVPLPKELLDFIPVAGEKHTAVSSKGDLHFHIRADSQSICYDMAAEISDLLNKVAVSVEEIKGFRYWDGRSILGFVDGTENPHGQEREFFGVVGDDDPDYKGGSYLFVQKYIHDLTAWKELSVQDQEKVIGRSKPNDIEMADEVKPANSHIALANVGDDLKIVRDNMPFGSMSKNEMGTYFIAYASKFSTVQKMLNNMFIGSPIGNYDRILDFSSPKTGSLFFVPTVDMMDEFSSN